MRLEKEMAMKQFIPRVTRAGKTPSAPMLAWAQGRADEAYGRLRVGADGLETEAIEICASDRAVIPHRDTEGTAPGMRIYGLVLRSDGHRLHSDLLHEAGTTDGLELVPGDLYEINPFDRHWTTVPDDAVKPQIIFHVVVMHHDGRTPKKMAHDLWWNVLAASIDALRAQRDVRTA